MRDKSGRRPTILLAEDDPGDQELVKVAFAKNGYEADLRIVRDGREALDYLLHASPYSSSNAPTPDLLLLDLNMPKMTGSDLLGRLKHDPNLRSIPVVVFTTSEAEVDIQQCYGLGCNSFITKPTDVTEFIATIRRLWTYWFELVALPRR